jgi:outer membrane protein OmpA-like peptidoglycan-associated protein
MRLPIPALFLCAGIAPFAYADIPPNDTVKGATDHPLLSRFQGARLVGHGVKQFDEVRLPAGKHVGVKDGKAVFEKDLRLEGKHTRIAYNYAKDRSSLEVMRNYQAALEKSGLKILFSCAKDACGASFGEFMLNTRLDGQFIKGGSEYWSPFNYGRNDERYLLASGTRPDKTVVHVAVYVVEPVQDKNGGIYLEIVESLPMETGKVSASLSASDMAKSIATEGRVAVYGVYFDTDRADVKPESKAALGEMAKLLQQNPAMKVHVVGHTDNQGTLAHNVDLSQKRADAVVKALAAEFKVDARRMSAKGVASYAPVASNDQEAGREKNRRVELVKQ